MPAPIRREAYPETSERAPDLSRKLLPASRAHNSVFVVR